MELEQPIRLLIVEDSEDDAELLAIELTRNKLPLEDYTRVQTAEEMNRALDEQEWDFVISDHHMPGFSALEALKIIQERRLDIPFIIVSGVIGEDMAVQAMRSGAHDYILKGNLARLIPAIQRELQEAKQRKLRRDVEQENLRFNERIKILHDIDRAILSAQSTEEIAGSVLQRLCTILGASDSYLILVQKDQEYYCSVLAHASVDGGGGVTITYNTHDHITVGPSTTFMSRPYASWLGTEEETERFRNLLDELGISHSASFVASPIITGDWLFGNLVNVAAPDRNFTNDQVEVSREVADQLAVALQQALLHEKIEQHALELEDRVTERTRELREANQELEAFTHSVSHDLRSPLRAVQGYVEALSEEYAVKLDDRGQFYLQSISEGARRMDQLIQDLLTYSQLRLQTLRLWPVSLATALTTAMDSLSQKIRSTGATIEVEGTLPRVTGDQEIMSTVLKAILQNSITYVNPGTAPVIRLRAENREGAVRLYVRDNGIGIPEEYHEQIFRIFERLHSSEEFEGNGIGLAIVRKGMERMGGSCGIASSDSSGSTFWLEWEKKVA